MNIRIATAFDAKAVAGLHAANWRIAYRGMMSDEYLDGVVVAERTAAWDEHFRAPAVNQHMAVAEINQEIVGFACAYGAEDAQWGTLLENLHVSNEQKRQGVGAQLMAHVASWCVASYPGNGMFLWVVEQNTSARRFYERLGAVNSGHDVWTSPDGREIPKLRYSWQSLDPLLVHTGNGRQILR